MGVRVSAAVACLVSLVLASSALADTTTSTNWAGYAVHGRNVSYRTIQAGWWQPTVACIPGRSTYSSYWIGLGGYRRTSQAIEQIGTEVDCTRRGSVRSSAWYELLPAPSTPIRLAVHPGDLMAATVTVVGREVTMSLRDLTTKQSFSRNLHAHVLDVSSAEWIVEAPSDCVGALGCETLPLANFGSVTFVGTTVIQRNGHLGTITDPSWASTMISLNPLGRRFPSARAGAAGIGGAIPGSPSPGGGGFVVKYAALPGGGGLPLGAAADVRLAPMR